MAVEAHAGNERTIVLGKVKSWSASIPEIHVESDQCAVADAYTVAEALAAAQPGRRGWRYGPRGPATCSRSHSRVCFTTLGAKFA